MTPSSARVIPMPYGTGNDLLELIEDNREIQYIRLNEEIASNLIALLQQYINTRSPHA